MKYLVLRKRAETRDWTRANSFLELASARPAKRQIDLSKEFTLPFEVTTHQDLSDADASDLRRDPKVEAVVLSIPFTLIAPVKVAGAGGADPAATTVWGLDAVGALDGPRSGEGVTVAVLDTGIDTKHPAFVGRKFARNDLMDFTRDEQGVAGAAPDTHGHGTHVAGTIFGGEVGGKRIGVAPGVSKALIGKILGPKGASSEVVLNGIEWALKNGADVISMSLGIDFAGLVEELEKEDGLPSPIAASRALEAYRSTVRLFDRLAGLVDARVADGHGALLIAAAGNESQRTTNPQFTVAVAPPAAADGFISVGALGKTNTEATPFVVASFSNTGCRLAAPGVAILSAKLGGTLVAYDGTSMATPHVAGVAALWIQELFPAGDRPIKWAKDVQSALENNAVKLSAPRNDVGLGLVQAPGGAAKRSPRRSGKQGRPKSAVRQGRKSPRTRAK
jgi:subtilisin family serine protease